MIFGVNPIILDVSDIFVAFYIAISWKRFHFGHNTGILDGIEFSGTEIS